MKNLKELNDQPLVPEWLCLLCLFLALYGLTILYFLI
jgi:hypothetical protein